MSSGDATTAGMKAGGFYDLHSEYQRRVIEAGDPLLARLAGELDLDAWPGSIAIVDYGASTGATSSHAVSTVLRAFADRGVERDIVVVHNDVPTNDFTQLFQNVTGKGGYLGIGQGSVYPMACAGSFFHQVLPRSSVHLGMCSNASHWFREQPAVAAGAGMYFADVPDGARSQLERRAAEDWSEFLSARCAELAPGGRLLVQGIGTVTDGDGAERVSASRLLGVMWAVAQELVDAGALDKEALDRYVFPVYCRSAEEATAPIGAGGPLCDELEPLFVDVVEVANPYWEELERSGDRAAYAEAYTQFVRAFSDSTLRDHLFASAGDAEALSDDFFRRFRERSAADPDSGRYEAWILRVAYARV